MDSIQVRETLERQLQLLSERSAQEVTTAQELCALTDAMTRLISAPWPFCE
ncbi:hypothetical protein [Intestinimonas butyriciproducens]|uniref:hypothetical protein n=1 Tax=Intestinimonas butyriciproducens TaxID=1297617 RepID=UPI0013EB4A46|nr:hypothetical protein [Intestinimonas butyriciproducens]MCR1905152.1 hypothetical protein [Intestinimonas butyriciproducens]